MKKKELTALKSKSLKELESLVVQKKVEAENVKLKNFAGQEKNLKVRKNLRIEIARILTLTREKSIIEVAEAKKEEVK